MRKTIVLHFDRDSGGYGARRPYPRDADWDLWLCEGQVYDLWGIRPGTEEFLVTISDEAVEGWESFERANLSTYPYSGPILGQIKYVDPSVLDYWAEHFPAAEKVWVQVDEITD